MKSNLNQLFLAYFLKNTQSICINSICISNSSINVNIANLDFFLFQNFFKFFSADLIFSSSKLFDLWCVDNFSLVSLSFMPRFSVNYMFFNIAFPTFRIFIKSFVDNCETFSLSSLYWSSTWLEREVWDMFGIKFVNNLDLRRILTDYGFCGFPLRKDFPTSGYTQVRYDEEIKAVISEPVSLSQKYRYFEFISPWRLLVLWACFINHFFLMKLILLQLKKNV